MAWAPDYCTPGELAAFVRSNDPGDVRLPLAIAAASRAIDRSASRGRYPGRQFGQLDDVEARYYTARYEAATGRWIVPIDDLMTTTGLSLAFDTDGDRTFATALSVPLPRPVNAAQTGQPWTELLLDAADSVTAVADAVRVTARWGWDAVPDPVKQACLLQASRLLVRRDSPYGVAGSPEAGTEIRLLARLDPDVEVSLAPYRRARKVVFG